MHLTYNNVDQALKTAMQAASGDYKNITSEDNYTPLYFQMEDTRNGKALVMQQLFAVTYNNPLAYVLRNKARNANPFFHFIEAVWMFAGCNTVSPLHYFCNQIKEYSDDSPRMPLYSKEREQVRLFRGAYGHRWRKNFSSVHSGYGDYDQLLTIISMLRRNPNTRRAVLQIWDPEWDLGANSKDIPCNMSCVFQVHKDKLHMTVYNRSNDLVWGLFGSNVVHFSMLLEFIALSSGIPVGTYTHVTCNAHIYEQHWPLLESMALDTESQTAADPCNIHIPVMDTPRMYHTDPQAFLIHCAKFISLLKQYIHVGDGPLTTLPFRNVWTPCGNPFLDVLGVSLVDAWVSHKRREYYHARTIISTNVGNTHWYIPCINWLNSRQRAYNSVTGRQL